MTVSRETFGPSHFFDLENVWFAEIFRDISFPWELLAKDRKESWIRKVFHPNVSSVAREGALVVKTTRFRTATGEATVEAGSYLAGDQIELRGGVTVEAGAWVTGPTILGMGTVVRHGAYLRGGIVTGENVVLGHASEVKSSIFLNGAKAPHFAYVGDSILGNRVNLGAGTKVSNLKITNDEVILRIEGVAVHSGLRKFGAILGDDAETGCNSVLNPGTLLGKKCLVYPCASVRNRYYAPGSVVK